MPVRMMRMKKWITEAQKTKQNIFHQLELALRLQGTTKMQLADALGVTRGRITQIFDRQSMSVDQLCEALDFLGMEITICGKSDTQLS